MSIPIGAQLQASPNSWDGYPTTYTYQWQRSANGSTGWADITDATYSDYVVQIADAGYYLRPVETASNVAGTTSQAAAAVGPVTGVIPGTAGSFTCRTFTRH